ncbi:MAG: hypothetical protein ACM3S1_00310, partial [Hyphomicrobiales bacterium]
MEQRGTASDANLLAPLVGMRLLVVSQSLEWAADRARGLEALGYRVALCGEPRAAREAIERVSPESVVVDLDREVAFPADVVAALRATSPVPVLVVGCAG